MDKGTTKSCNKQWAIVLVKIFERKFLGCLQVVVTSVCLSVALVGSPHMDVKSSPKRKLTTSEG